MLYYYNSKIMFHVTHFDPVTSQITLNRFLSYLMNDLMTALLVTIYSVSTNIFIFVTQFFSITINEINLQFSKLIDERLNLTFFFEIICKKQNQKLCKIKDLFYQPLSLKTYRVQKSFCKI